MEPLVCNADLFLFQDCESRGGAVVAKQEISYN